jgi:hypothetical protein
VYTWSGNPTDPAFLMPLSISALNVEGVLEVSQGGIPQGDKLQVLSDLGGSKFYDGADAKDLVFTNHKKYRSDLLVTSSLLPAYFVNFSARKYNQETALQWTMAQSDYISYFEVQQSTDGRTFQTIVKLSSSKTDKNYQYNTATVQNATTYYRIKAVEENGNVIYSITGLIKSLQNTVQVYPTLVTGGSTQIKVPGSGEKRLKVFRSDGSLFTSTAFNGNDFTLYTSGWANGVYVINVSYNQAEYTIQKIIVQQ